MRVCPGCRTVYDEQVITCPKDGLPLIDRSPTFARLQEEETPAPKETPPKEEDTAVRPGLMIGEYQVEHVIAEGGMGVIYAGIHPLIRKRVAVKVLNKRFAQEPKAVARFVLEARSVNEIGHHNIVDIFSIGELDDQRNYLIMEYLDGLALHEILLKVKRLRPGEVVPIYEQLCDALKLAHGKEFVHRDLKPDNIIVLRRPPYPFIKILDFGLAKLRGSITSTNTEVGTVLGTPEYMAPEQCRGDVVDARTDIYALGVMLYELVTGRRPFTDKSPFRVLAMQQREMPKPPSRHVELPEALEWVILRAMAKHPNQRFQSVDELLEHLNRAVTERVTWNINLDPIDHSVAQPTNPPEEEMVIPAYKPPPPQKMANLPNIPMPVSISDEMSDDEMETLVADSRPGNEQPDEILAMLRKDEVAQEIRGDADSQEIAMPAVRNVRLAPAAARAPEPLLGVPQSGELEEGATEVSDPPDLMEELDAEPKTTPKPLDPPSEAKENKDNKVAFIAAPATADDKPAADAKPSTKPDGKERKPAAPAKPAAPEKPRLRRPSVTPEPALTSSRAKEGSTPAANRSTPAAPKPDQVKEAQRRSGSVPAAQKQKQKQTQRRSDGGIRALDLVKDLKPDEQRPGQSAAKSEGDKPAPTSKKSQRAGGKEGPAKPPIVQQKTKPLGSLPLFDETGTGKPLFDDSTDPSDPAAAPTSPLPTAKKPSKPAKVQTQSLPKPPAKPAEGPLSQPPIAAPRPPAAEPPPKAAEVSVDVDVISLTSSEDEDEEQARAESAEFLVDRPPEELRSMQASESPPSEEPKVSKVESGVYSLGQGMDPAPPTPDQAEDDTLQQEAKKAMGTPGHARTVRDLEQPFAKQTDAESPPAEPDLEFEAAGHSSPGEVKAHWSEVSSPVAGPVAAGTARKTALSLNIKTMLLVVTGAALVGVILVLLLYYFV